MDEPNTPVAPSKSRSPLLGYLAITIVAAAAIAGMYVWQHGQQQVKVRSLNSQIVALKKTQVSAKTFANYNDCVNHGGDMFSYDGAIQFEGCLGGGNQLFLQYSSQNLPQVTSNQTTTVPNVIASGASATSDLTNYLKYSYSGCQIGEPAGTHVTGYYKVLKEVPSGWALLNYGCSSDSQANKNSSYIIAMKLSSGWVQLSPTNNFRSNGTPSCLLVDMYKIPEALVNQCYQNTGYNNGSLRKVTNS